MAKLKCPECGNTTKFTVNAREYHTWAVDGDGNFVSDLGCDDSEKGSEYDCGECNHFPITEVAS